MNYKLIAIREDDILQHEYIILLQELRSWIGRLFFKEHEILYSKDDSGNFWERDFDNTRVTDYCATILDEIVIRKKYDVPQKQIYKFY